MKLTPYQRKMAENEVVFREHNEKIQRGLEKLKATAHEDGQTDLLSNLDSTLHFICECSDEKCTERIIMRPSKYDELHKSKKHFLIVPGHKVPAIENTVKKTPKYEVVKKHSTPNSPTGGLQPTALHN